MRAPQGDEWKWVIVGALGLIAVGVVVDVANGTAHAVTGGGPGSGPAYVALRQQLVKPPVGATYRRRRSGR